MLQVVMECSQTASQPTLFHPESHGWCSHGVCEASDPTMSIEGWDCLAPQTSSAHVLVLRMTINMAPSLEKLGHCTQPVPGYWMTLVLDKIAVFMEESTGTYSLKGAS